MKLLPRYRSGRPCPHTNPSSTLLLTDAVLCLIFSFTAITGNGFIILSVILDPLKRLRSPFSYFLVNLAVSDFLAGCVAMPLTATLYILKTKDLPTTQIHTTAHMGAFISAMASLLSLAALCIDRYAAIKWPFAYRTKLSIKRCVLITIGIWVISIGVPFSYFSIRYVTFMRIHLHVAVCVGLPILLITYYNVNRLMRKNTKRLDNLRKTSLPSETARLDKARESARKVTRVFLIIISLFVGTYIPAIIINYTLEVIDQKQCVLFQSLTYAVLLLVLFNSCVNPFVCLMRMKPFRNTLRYFLGKCFKRFETPAIQTKKRATSDDATSLRLVNNIQST